MEFKNPYALRDGKIVYIEDLSPSERGLACNCVCPCCGKRMVAKLGEVNEHHFSHYESPDCSGGYETALHLLAKELLAEKIPILLPSIHSNLINTPLIQEDGTVLAVPEIIKTQSITPDEIRTEESLGLIRPDAIVIKKNHQLIVEVYVSHAVDKQKLEKIKELKTSAIEIDLSEYKYKLITREKLKDLISNSCEHKRWLYNKKEEAEYKYIDSLLKTSENNLFELCSAKIELNPQTNILTSLFKYKTNFIRIPDCPKKPNFDGQQCYANTKDCLECSSFGGFLRRLNTPNNSEVLCSMAKASDFNPSQEQILDYIEERVKITKAEECNNLEAYKRKLEKNLIGLKEEYKNIVGFEDIIRKKLDEFSQEKTKELYELLNKELYSWIKEIAICESYQKSLEKNKQQFLSTYPLFKRIPKPDLDTCFEKNFRYMWSNQLLIIKKHFFLGDFNNFIESVLLKTVQKSMYPNFEGWLQACIEFTKTQIQIFCNYQGFTVSVIPYLQDCLERQDKSNPHS